jgi:hypothetical protein
LENFKKILDYEMQDSNLFPKEIFKEFYKIEIIDDLEIWFQLIKTRNTLSHFYSETISTQSFSFLQENYKVI